MFEHEYKPLKCVCCGKDILTDQNIPNSIAGLAKCKDGKYEYVYGCKPCLARVKLYLDAFLELEQALHLKWLQGWENMIDEWIEEDGLELQEDFYKMRHQFIQGVRQRQLPQTDGTWYGLDPEIISNEAMREKCLMNIIFGVLPFLVSILVVFTKRKIVNSQSGRKYAYREMILDVVRVLVVTIISLSANVLCGKEVSIWTLLIDVFMLLVYILPLLQKNYDYVEKGIDGNLGFLHIYVNDCNSNISDVNWFI